MNYKYTFNTFKKSIAKIIIYTFNTFTPFNISNADYL